jgi:hypothetical protein
MMQGYYLRRLPAPTVSDHRRGQPPMFLLYHTRIYNARVQLFDDALGWHALEIALHGTQQLMCCPGHMFVDNFPLLHTIGSSSRGLIEC